jgi:hypothetical protein
VQLEVAKMDGVRSGIHGMSRKIPTGGGGGGGGAATSVGSSSAPLCASA